MVQAREGQLMAKTLLLGEIVQLAGDTPQRANHQPVDAPVSATVSISTRSK